MEEDESFDEFYAKLKDIVNSAFNLGEIISKPKIMRKVLRFQPKRFHAKITTIEVSKASITTNRTFPLEYIGLLYNLKRILLYR